MDEIIIIIEPLCSLQWLSQFLSGLATCVGYAWSRRPASPSPIHVALARGVCASGLCGSCTGPRGPPSPAAAEQWFQLSGVRPRVPLPLLSSLGHLGVQQQL